MNESPLNAIHGTWNVEKASLAMDIRITLFEEFVSGSHGFITSLLDYFGISRGFFNPEKLPRKEAQTHFREGRTDKWMDVFSPDQKAAATLPDNLSERFGGPKA